MEEASQHRPAAGSLGFIAAVDPCHVLLHKELVYHLASHTHRADSLDGPGIVHQIKVSSPH